MWIEYFHWTCHGFWLNRLVNLLSNWHGNLTIQKKVQVWFMLHLKYCGASSYISQFLAMREWHKHKDMRGNPVMDLWRGLPWRCVCKLKIVVWSLSRKNETSSDKFDGFNEGSLSLLAPANNHCTSSGNDYSSIWRASIKLKSALICPKLIYDLLLSTSIWVLWEVWPIAAWNPLNDAL